MIAGIGAGNTANRSEGARDDLRTREDISGRIPDTGVRAKEISLA